VGRSPLTRDRQSSLWSAGFDATWELDVFGSVSPKRPKAANGAGSSSRVEDRRDVLVTLLSEVALNYVDLRGRAARPGDHAKTTLRAPAGYA